MSALLAKGADTTIADKNGQTALQRAQNSKLDVVVRLLNPASVGAAANTNEDK